MNISIAPTMRQYPCVGVEQGVNKQEPLPQKVNRLVGKPSEQRPTQGDVQLCRQ